jgi:hypothetical protein
MLPECVVEESETDTFVVLDGVRIAKRGRPDTPEVGTWLVLVPGYRVSDSKDGLKVEIVCALN